MQATSVKTIFGKVPPAVRQFILRAVLFFAAWLLVYHLVLQPMRIPDRWLTNATAWSVTKFAGIFYGDVRYMPVAPGTDTYFSKIFLQGHDTLNIADGCNALDLMVLYISFLICVPTTARRVLLFATAGIAAIFLLNVLRCTALIWVSQHFSHLFDFAHKYLFTAIVYCFIFLLWVLYARKYSAGAV